MLLVILLFLPLIFCQNVPREEWKFLNDEEATKRGWNLDRLKHMRFSGRLKDTQTLLVVHQGDIVFHYGNITKKFISKAIRKGLVWSLFGDLIQKKFLNLTDTMEDLEIQDEPPLSRNERSAKLVHLFKSISGIFHDAIYEYGFQTKPKRDSVEPGTYFLYNNWDHNVVASIYEKFTNSSIFQDFLTKIAKPIQMQDYKANIGPNHIETDENPYSPYDNTYDGFYITGNKSIHPAYQFLLTPRDLARFAVLMMNNGNWNGYQIIPWIWTQKVLSYNRKSFDYFFWDNHWMKKVFNPQKGVISLLGARDSAVVMVPMYDIAVLHFKNEDLSAKNSSESELISDDFLPCVIAMTLESFYSVKRNPNNRSCPIGLQEDFALYSFWISVASSSTVVVLIFSATVFVICSSMFRMFQKNLKKEEEDKNYEVLQ